MKLTIDERTVTARPGQTLLELVQELGLDAAALSARELCAAIQTNNLAEHLSFILLRSL